MRINNPAVRVVSVFAAFGMLIAGCGFGDGANASADVEAGSGTISVIDELEGVSLRVGSKDFDEQFVLGQIAVLALEAAGASPVDKTNIQGTVNIRRALTSGNIDLYWDYTGTAWITFLDHTDPVPGRQAQWEAVAEEDRAKNGIMWLDPAPMNNTYALATTAEVAERLSVSALSDLAALAPEELTFCLENEFASRDDGFEPMAKTYGFAGAVDDAAIKVLDTGLVYSQTAEGGVCNFGEVFTTDGRIPALDLVVLEDDKGFFPLYNAALTLREETLEEHPALADLFAPITQALTTEAIQGMNERVSVDGQTARTAAMEWMKAEGFIA